MKLFQIRGEVLRRIGKLIKTDPKPYPAIPLVHTTRKIGFYCCKLQAGGATYLRQQQLFEICSLITQAYVAHDPSEIQPDSLVIGAKGSLNEFVSASRRFAGQNIKFVYDPIDELIDLDVLSALNMDGLIASSYRQYSWLRSRLETPVFLLPHHADLRIANIAQKATSFRLAYFGALKNAFLTPELSRHMDVFNIADHNDIAWTRELANYSCHYCVRRKAEKSNAYKPATKLFVAAKTGAAVITTRDESDAELLLPPDYPFFCASRTPAAILETIDFAAKSFGTPIFAKAVADVARINGWSETDQHRQLNLMLNLV